MAIDISEGFIMKGFLLINKPAGITSFGCIWHVRRLIGKGIKVGHGGTLDKFATGLLIVGIGREATKHLGQLLQMSKGYVGTGKLGELTDTYDLDGKIIKQIDVLVKVDDLSPVLASFGSGYIQTPPVYSALKFAGQRLSDIHRADDFGKQAHEIALTKSRYINLYELKLEKFDFPYFTIKAQVSSGTYIRSLINDIAVKLGTCATTVQLSRTFIGPFKLAQAQEIASLDLNLIQNNLIPVSELQAAIDSYDQTNSCKTLSK